MALPPRAPAAASESEAKLASSVAGRDLMVSVAYACSTVSGSTSCSGTTYTSSWGSYEVCIRRLCIDDKEKAKRRERAKVLLDELCHGDSDGDGDRDIPERWLSEMGVGWVLDVADDPSAGTRFVRAQFRCYNLTERWIQALTEITEPTYLEYIVRGTDVPGRVRLLRIFEATILKMLPFIDALLAAADLDASTDTAGVSNGAQTPSVKLQALLDVRDALSSASEGVELCFDWDSSAEIEAQGRKLLSLLLQKEHRLDDLSKLLSLLLEKEHRLDEAIWNTMEEVRTNILSDDDDNKWGIQTRQGSPDICKVTWSLVTYIRSLWNNTWRVDHIVSAAAEIGSYVPNRDIISSFLLSVEQDETDPFTLLTLEMISSLEVKLNKRSESFPDHSLRFIFLINNTHFIWQNLHLTFSMKYKEVLGLKIEDYIQKYLQASWAPVMSCLYNHAPRWFRKNSTLPKFDFKFQKIYTAHKHWKVPDPELRTRLRTAVVEEVVPGLTGYLEANNITSPGVTPQEREKMLLELFEG